MKDLLENYVLEGELIEILTFPNPVLIKKAVEVEEHEFNDELKTLCKNMLYTMYKSPGIGLAAPQIGISKRFFVIDVDYNREETEEDSGEYVLSDFAPKVFINPIIEEESGEEWGFNEGCLSIPKIREEVFRKEKITISYYDENWALKEEVYDGYAARIIQHEYDHIDGVLFTDHLSPLKKRLLKNKLQNISKGDISIDYRMRFPMKKKKR